MPKVFTDAAYKKFIGDWNHKLTEAEQKSHELMQALQEKDRQHQIEIAELQSAFIDVEKIVSEAKLSVAKANDEARNSKERAKRYKKKIEKLEHELQVVPKNHQKHAIKNVSIIK